MTSEEAHENPEQLGREADESSSQQQEKDRLMQQQQEEEGLAVPVGEHDDDGLIITSGQPVQVWMDACMHVSTSVPGRRKKKTLQGKEITDASIQHNHLIYPSIYLSIHSSIYVSIYLSTHLSMSR